MTTYDNTGSTMPGDGGAASSPPASPVVASFIASLSTDLGGIAPVVLGSFPSTLNLSASAAIVVPGATVKIDAGARAGLLVQGGSSVDLSASHKAGGSPVPLSVVASGGQNKILLNHGPTYAVSLDGNDTMVSSGGHDFLRSTVGHDSLVGGGKSYLHSDSGVGDTLVGGLFGAAQDTMVSFGSSLIQTSFGHNVVVSSGGDTIRAGVASDTISTGDGATTVRGGDGSTVYGSGQSSIRAAGGQNNTFNFAGNDTLVAGRGTGQVVNLTDSGQASVHGGVSHIDVNLGHRTGDDTLFGGSGGLTIHLSAGAGAIVNDPNTLDASGHHIVRLAGGETLHVSNVTIDFGNGQRKDV